METLRGKRVLVVGLGETGLSAARFLKGLGASVVVNDARTDETLGPRLGQLRALGVEAVLGGHDPDLFTSVDQIVISPGVPPMPALRAADDRGVPIASEVELASWFIRGTVVAVTGTNGKSTVTTLLGEMCRATGRPTFVGGNLGTPLIEVVHTEAARPDGFVVVELSSFQLERVDRFRAHVALLLNVSEDHLDRYDSYAEYVAAKGRIFHGQGPCDHAVVPASSELCRSLARATAGTVHTFGPPSGEVRWDDTGIVNGQSGLFVPLSAIRLRGRHNVDNACAAALGARLSGVSAEPIRAVLERFPGLPHRMQFVREVSGVQYFDDSKGTNVGAAVASLRGFGGGAGKVVLIAGGKDKGGSYAPLRDELSARGRAVVLIGEAALRIEEALEGAGLEIVRAASMEDAVARATTLARAGDAVLLSPACSSFDMFQSYAERGDVFQRAVCALPGEGV